VLTSSVTDAGLVDLVMAPALEVVDLRKCTHIAVVAMSFRALLSGR
jgi:hypothetical protein